jgi:hypoxanthine phosphoribosyltransferase
MSQAAALPSIDTVPGSSLKILIDQKTIETRVGELAEEISNAYCDRELVVIAILKGAQLFACDLVRKLTIYPALDFMSISSYKRNSESSEVTIVQDLEVEIAGKDVLVIEDIVDTGLTLDYLIRELQKRDPESVAICTLLDRPELRLAEIPMRFVGFNVSEEFLVGYGLDYREQFRELPYIASIEV